MRTITTFLTFPGNAEEALDFYGSVFENAKVRDRREYPPGSPFPEGTFMTATVELEGTMLSVLNAPGAEETFTFAPGISLFVGCDTQEEVDELWEKLSEGGQEQPCGWVTDRFGVSWQVVPRRLGELLASDSSGRVMQAMLKMKKIEIAELERAAEGAPAAA